MKNLAGDQNCDKDISEELTMAGIQRIHGSSARGEVPASIQGKIKTPHGEITLTRAWYYWVAEGAVPLEVANKIYSHPQGKASVRAGGHCGCVSPDTQTEWFDAAGKKLGRISELEKIECTSFREQIRNSGSYRWVEDREAEGKPYVTTYHIDDQAGLLLFSLMVTGQV